MVPRLLSVVAVIAVLVSLLVYSGGSSADPARARRITTGHRQGIATSFAEGFDRPLGHGPGSAERNRGGEDRNGRGSRERDRHGRCRCQSNGDE